MPSLQISILPFLTLLLGCVVFLFMLYFAIVSWREEEPLAFKRALLLTFILPLPYFIVGLNDFESQSILCIVLLVITLLIPLFFLFPIGNSFRLVNDTPKTRIDERDIMFSRKLLIEGTDRFKEYYKRNPHNKILDEKFRSQPGLLQKESSLHDPITFAAAEASFKTVNAFHKILDDDNLKLPAQKIDSENMVRFIKKWLKSLGSVSIGVTELRDYHKYSIIGRGEKYGEEVELDHKYAIAFTVEMDKYLLDRAPKGPTVMESAQQYLSSGTIAVQLAEFIRQLGYSARAHIDGSYRVVCPLVARDAGLGEIGRMGLLMTPELGPRVRIAVVTTDLPLIIDNRKPEPSTIDFCTQCKKCADVCPAKAISFDERETINGVIRWQINSEACFTLWSKMGTDCARCMSVCPYSHPDTTLHDLVRFGVKQSGPFRKVALKLDDFFYGRKPASLDLPDWMKKITINEDT